MFLAPIFLEPQIEILTHGNQRMYSYLEQQQTNQTNPNWFEAIKDPYSNQFSEATRENRYVYKS